MQWAVDTLIWIGVTALGTIVGILGLDAASRTCGHIKEHLHKE